MSNAKKLKKKAEIKTVKIGSVVCRKYLLIKEIGKGTFGNIFLGKNTETNEEFAVKIENIKTDVFNKPTETLLKEAKILYELKGERGFPRMYYFIKDDKLSIMVMTLLHKNFSELWKENEKKLSLKTVLMAADQMITRLEYLHSQGVVHRDIKPENFMIGTDQTLIYLIDFGLSKKYRDEGGAHNPCREGVGMVGTARYTSVYSHLGLEQSRRDDLESLGYVMIYFLKGKLPWMNIQADTKAEKHQRIGEMKMKMTSTELCKGLPMQFLQYFEYVKGMSYTQEPNYGYLKKLFRTLLLNNMQMNNNNLKYDWEVKSNLEKKDESTSTFNTDLTDKKKMVSIGGRIKPIQTGSNQLRVDFKSSKSKSMRTTKDKDDEENNFHERSNGV
jgi:serine/threonine protein kinase